MSLKSALTVFTSIGDILFGSAQAAAIGASFGNGAAQFGKNANNPLQMGDDGNLFVGFPATATPSNVSPAATGSDYVIGVFTIPVTAFDIAFRGISILAAGNAPNTNARTMKIILNPTNPVVGSVVSGGTTVATASNTAAQSGASGGWQIVANLFKSGSAGSNTQMAIHESGQIGSALTALTAPTTLALNEAAAVTVAITGNATTTTTDIVLNFIQCFAMN